MLLFSKSLGTLKNYGLHKYMTSLKYQLSNKLFAIKKLFIQIINKLLLPKKKEKHYYKTKGNFSPVRF